ncbi:hypothetical protein CDAR_481061 [Caerostris darwini]|uniref:Galectin n=1 Tax=Caerostris darwini TaxID=1538125 RepID=A0AAV4W581_9ARAC|nr:hypothetical protein CDAR_481061 [Caerostris darwini]
MILKGRKLNLISKFKFPKGGFSPNSILLYTEIENSQNLFPSNCKILFRSPKSGDWWQGGRLFPRGKSSSFNYAINSRVYVAGRIRLGLRNHSPNSHLRSTLAKLMHIGVCDIFGEPTYFEKTD